MAHNECNDRTYLSLSLSWSIEWIDRSLLLSESVCSHHWQNWWFNAIVVVQDLSIFIIEGEVDDDDIGQRLT